ncbi:hypothetical protein DO71_5666 [Burkholderia pseudomallei]|nr:hypothetical protein BG17_4507 [Burkholderia pseudomallei MSHR491]KGC89535.1 hypothetical protein DO71_5666 [Burkholderia pseudomallei]KGV18581.1 hypothetical protein X895_4615 [Burkholderia pseudomallei MSHR4503]KGV19569.1 hypothetical protein X891_3472 [Burkholderia pseudomallei TSV 43]KGV43515.1 hypothetical protein X893_4072 [Burkholderia pseudomallei TSV 31]KGX79493.1 hypothetical protein Y033_5922 [Burkholderia pseudomallei MSHR435]
MRTASRPDAPVAPFTSTVSPAASRARSVNAAHDDMPGIAMAAAVASSIESGNGMHCAAGTRVRSASAPNGAGGPKKYTRRPSSRRPTPSTPATNGKPPVDE